MQREKKKSETFFRAVRIAKAVTTLAVVAVPVVTAVGIIAGYGAYSLFRRIRRSR